jgi:hypothetical protein
LSEALVDRVEDVEDTADLDHFGTRHREHHDAPETHRRLLLVGVAESYLIVVRWQQ